MKTNQSGIDLIKGFEKLKLEAYNTDGAGVWTIGYGSTGPDVKAGVTWTANMAEARFSSDLAKFEVGVNKIVTDYGLELTGNQFSALVSFAYNLGVGTLRNSSIIRHLDNDEIQLAANVFDRYVNVRINGVLKKLQGLVNRRAAEKKLFLTA